MHPHQAADPQLTTRQRLWFATLVTALILVAFLVSCSSCAGNMYPADVPTQMDVAVARMVRVVNGKEAGYCTVFKAGSHTLMTAGHCCGRDEDPDPVKELLSYLLETKGKGPKIEYHAAGPHAVPGESFKVLRDDDDHDVCVLRGHLRGAPLRIAAYDPPLGAKVFTVGYPKGQFLISEGHWSGRNKDDESLASVAVWGGASGSPVMDSFGQVVGILRAYYPPMSNLSILSPVEWVRSTLLNSKP